METKNMGYIHAFFFRLLYASISIGIIIICIFLTYCFINRGGL